MVVASINCITNSNASDSLSLSTTAISLIDLVVYNPFSFEASEVRKWTVLHKFVFHKH